MVGDGGLLSGLRGLFLANDVDPITLNIVKTFPTGWKNLPQELVNEILTYLEDDFPSLVSCSHSCKALFCSTRPLIHRTLCLSTGYSTDRHCSSSLNRAQFNNLRLAERAQVLRYTTRLIVRLGDDLVPENLRPHLKYFRLMRGITSLEIYLLDATIFLPAFDECFSHIVPTLRSLILIGARDPIEDVFHFISRFPLLQDLDLMQFSLARRKPSQPYTLLETTPHPPLNGTLRFRGTYPSVEFIKSLVNVPGGIHFRSVEMGDAREVPLQMIIDACPNTVELVTFRTGYPRVTPNLQKCTVLKGLWIVLAGGIEMYNDLEVYLSRILSTIVSPSFSTFIVRLSGLGACDPTQPFEAALDSLKTRGAVTEMAFRVETIDPLACTLPAGTRHSLMLEPCRWDVGWTP